MHKTILVATTLLLASFAGGAHNATGAVAADTTAARRVSRLQVGGYGEVAKTRNFFGDSYLRYVAPGRYKDAL